MIIYLFLIAFTFGAYFFLYQFKNGRFWYCFFSFLLLTAISGIRRNIGVDYNTYLELYNRFLVDNFVGDFEPGFMFLEAVCIKLKIGFRGVLVISAVITQGYIMWAIYRKSPFPNLSVLMYITIGYYYATMNQIRMYIAISIGVFAVTLLAEKKIAKYFFLIIIASFFHYTALILIPAFLALNLPWRVRQLLISVGIGICAMFFIRPILKLGILIFPRYEYYLSSAFASGYGIQSLHRAMLIFVPFLMYRKYLLKQSKENLIYINCALYGFLLSIFQLQFQLFERFAIYLMLPALIIGWPQIVNCYKNGERRVLIEFFIFGLCMIYNFYILQRGWMGVVPFQSIFK